MAPSKKDNKRKAAAAAAAADSPAKKTKKAEAKPAEAPKEASKSILKKNKDDGAPAAKKSASGVKFNGEPARQIKPRKRAADFLSDDEDSESEAEAKPAKAQAEKKASNKKSKKEDGTAAPAAKAKTAGAKASPKSKKPEAAADESDDDNDDSAASDSGEGEEEEEDDRTVALIKGFESSGDEDESGDEGYDPSKPVPKIPDSKKAKRKILKKQKEEKAGSGEGPGAVYVGRIPHGFYEHQMRAYFSQFGEITRLRLSRNRITGRSKHYAFVEFESVSVAKIVAATMDNYLMYGHILKCKYIPSDQLHPEVWKGANRRFKKTPWNRIEKKRLDKGKTRDQWSERIEREQKKRLAKAEKLKDLGYEFELPQLMSVDEVPVQEEGKQIEAPKAAEEETPKAVEAPKETKAEKKSDDTPKKSKKEKKGSQSVTEQDTPKQDGKKGANDATASPATKAGAKAKKGKAKSKSKA